MLRRATGQDVETVAALMRALWPHHSLEEMRQEAQTLLADPTVCITICDDIAFAQCSLRRDYVEGTETSPVGYLEGIYVSPRARGQGVARALVDYCAEWARSQGCRELASDCELENSGSLAFHLAAGFEEANRIICFVKKL